MQKLIDFINQRLKWANENREYAQSMFHQAYGALQFYIETSGIDNTEYRTLELLWEHTYLPAFEDIVYAPIEEPSKKDGEWRSKPGNPFI